MAATATNTDRDPATPGRGWPRWARRLVSAAILFHITAMLAAALAAPPSSALERGLAHQFHHYFELIDQGYSYRFYAPAPPPTPVVEARMHFADGRPDQTIRLPDRALRPRLRYQRQLALANHLFVEFAAARDLPEGVTEPPPSHWAPSYARHLGSVHGCSSVTLYVRHHMIPEPEKVQAASAEGKPFDIDAEEFYTVPERIGEFPCDAS
jgi:hypothetical protein